MDDSLSQVASAPPRREKEQGDFFHHSQRAPITARNFSPPRVCPRRPWQRIAVPAAGVGGIPRTIWKRIDGRIPAAEDRRFLTVVVELHSQGAGPRKRGRIAGYVPVLAAARWDPSVKEVRDGKWDIVEARVAVSAATSRPAPAAKRLPTRSAFPETPLRVVPRKRHPDQHSILPPVRSAPIAAGEQYALDLGISPGTEPLVQDAISRTANTQTTRQQSSTRRLSNRISLRPVFEAAGEEPGFEPPLKHVPLYSSPLRRRSAMTPTPRTVAMSPAKKFTVSMAPIQLIPEETTPAPVILAARPGPSADIPITTPRASPTKMSPPTATPCVLLVFDQPTPDIVVESEHETRRRISLQRALRSDRRSSIVARLFSAEARAVTNRRYSSLPSHSDSPGRNNRRNTLAFVKTGNHETCFDAKSSHTSTEAVQSSLPQTPTRRGEDNATVEVDVRSNLDIFGPSRIATAQSRDLDLNTPLKSKGDNSTLDTPSDAVRSEASRFLCEVWQPTPTTRTFAAAPAPDSMDPPPLVLGKCGLGINMASPPPNPPNPSPEEQPSHLQNRIEVSAAENDSPMTLGHDQDGAQSLTDGIASPTRAHGPELEANTAPATPSSSLGPPSQSGQGTSGRTWTEGRSSDEETPGGANQPWELTITPEDKQPTDMEQVAGPRPEHTEPISDNATAEANGREMRERSQNQHQKQDTPPPSPTPRHPAAAHPTPRGMAMTLPDALEAHADLASRPCKDSVADVGGVILPNPSTPPSVAQHLPVTSATPDGQPKVLLDDSLQCSGFTPINCLRSLGPKQHSSSWELNGSTVAVDGSNDATTSDAGVEPTQWEEDMTLEMAADAPDGPQGKRLSLHDDSETEMLRNFVTRVKADKTAKAAAAARAKLNVRAKRRSGSSGSTTAASGSPVSRKELASSDVLRVPLGEKDLNMSPSPSKKRKADAEQRLAKPNPRLSTPDLDDTTPPRPKRRRKKMEAETGGVFNPNFQPCQGDAAPEPVAPRRSTRTRTSRMGLKAPVPSANSAAPIPVRLPGHLNTGEDAFGASTAMLRRNEEKDLAALTRVNTRKNKGEAEYPKMVIARQTVSDSSLPGWRMWTKQRGGDGGEETASEAQIKDDAATETRVSKKPAGKRKSVRWAEILVRVQSEETQITKGVDAVLAPPGEAGAKINVPGGSEPELSEPVPHQPAAAKSGTVVEKGKQERGEQKKPVTARQTRASRLPPPTPTKALAAAAKTSNAAAGKVGAPPATGRASSTTGRIATQRSRISGLGMAGNGTPAPKRRATRGTS